MVSDNEFCRGMKLEAVDPDQPRDICSATITRTAGHLLWIHLDNSSEPAANHIVPVQSHDLFPVGWCGSNNYPLKPPRSITRRRKLNQVYSYVTKTFE